MKKKEVAAAIALLTASSALCLRLMKKVDEKLRRERRSGHGNKARPDCGPRPTRRLQSGGHKNKKGRTAQPSFLFMG